MNNLSSENTGNPESIESPIYTVLKSGQRSNDSIGMLLDLPRLGRTEEAARRQPLVCTLYPRAKGEVGYICEVSPQVGCIIGCDFCQCGEFRANLTPAEVAEQIRLLQTAAVEHGIPLEEVNKISFSDGGELLLNSHCMAIMRATVGHLPAEVKVSTVLPDLSLVRRNLAGLMEFARAYAPCMTLQVSLYSTNEEIRRSSAMGFGGRRREPIPLFSFDDIRHLGQEWTSNHPQRRKITLTFTLTSQSHVDPCEIVFVLPPELFRIRLHPHKDNNSGFERLDLSACRELKQRFFDAGYDDTHLDEYCDEDIDQFVDFGTASLVRAVLS